MMNERQALLDALLAEKKETARGYYAPIAEYSDGSFEFAWPQGLIDLGNALSGGMTADPSQFNHGDPSVRQAYEDQMTGSGLSAAALAVSGRPLRGAASAARDQAQASYRAMAYPGESSVRAIPQGAQLNRAGQMFGEIQPRTLDAANQVRLTPQQQADLKWGGQGSFDDDLAGLPATLKVSKRPTDFFSGLRTSPTGSITESGLYNAYKQWSARNGLEPISEAMFSRAASEAGLQRARIGGRIRYIGVE